MRSTRPRSNACSSSSRAAGSRCCANSSARRDEASANLDFEAAAALHARLDKVKPLASQWPEIARRLDELNGLMIQTSAEPDSVALFMIAAGQVCDPVPLNVGKGVPHPFSPSVGEKGGTELSARPQSMETRITEALAAVEQPKPHSALEWMEHLAILKRWYYRSSKTGELFLSEGNGELPMRRVVRGVSRVFRGEKPAADLSETAGDYWMFRAREAGITEK